MKDYVKVIKCYDTITKEYVDVPVTNEIEEFMRRSYWKEDIQERRYYKKITELNENVCHIEEFSVELNPILDSIIKDQTLKELNEVMNKLDEWDRLVLKLIYEQNKSISITAKELGISISYLCRVIKKIHRCLFELMNNKK